MGDIYRSNSIFDADLFCSVAGHGMTISRSMNNGIASISQIVANGNANSHTNLYLGASPAVEVRSAYKSFGSKNPVLEDMNMTVETGSIYSLLGSSGCGKTTLLLCVVGLQKLDNGSIRVFGESPGSAGSGVPGLKVGYMPQELSLYNEFSIEESLNYFGRLYGMSQEDIDMNMISILKLLDLPKPSRRISTLSGGQKRRVSFALATFHKAPLLILDEPTVGVDPLLREAIWSFLRHLVATRKTTVIITTHYIEEARQSNTVGVMRNGRLLVENSPQELIAKFKLPLLEQIVLTLCQNDQRDRGSPGQVQRKTEYLPPVKPPPPPRSQQRQYHRNAQMFCNQSKTNSGIIRRCDRESSNSKSSCDSSSLQELGGAGVSCCTTSCSPLSSYKRIIALTLKNLVVLLRSVWFLLFIFVVPAIQIVLICLAIGPDPKDLGFGVINNEMMDIGMESCPNITELPTLVGEAEGASEVCGIALSCRYLSMLPNQSLQLTWYKDNASALSDIQEGKIWGYVNFPSNFSTHLLDRGANPAFALDETYDGSKISFEMDMSNQQIGQNLKRIFIEVYYSFLVQVAVDCKLNPRQVELPLHFLPPLYGSDGTSFSEFLAPSVFLGLLFFFPLCSSGITYISEKKSGTLSRSLVAGVTTGEIMFSFLISQLGVLLIQSALAFVILNVVFGIPILGSVPLGLTLAILVGIGGMSMGFLISVMCKEEIHAVLLAIGSFFPNFLLAGMVWPIQGMPIFLQYVAHLLPCTLACESMRSIVSRGWGFTHPNVWPGFVSTIGWILLYWTLTLLLHNFTMRK